MLCRFMGKNNFAGDTVIPPKEPQKASLIFWHFHLMINCFSVTSNCNLLFPECQQYSNYLVFQIRFWEQWFVDRCSMKLWTQVKYYTYFSRCVWLVDPMIRLVPAFSSLHSRCWFSCIALQDQFLHELHVILFELRISWQFPLHVCKSLLYLRTTVW